MPEILSVHTLRLIRQHPRVLVFRPTQIPLAIQTDRIWFHIVHIQFCSLIRPQSYSIIVLQFYKSVVLVSWHCSIAVLPCYKSITSQFYSFLVYSLIVLQFYSLISLQSYKLQVIWIWLPIVQQSCKSIVLQCYINSTIVSQSYKSIVL